MTCSWTIVSFFFIRINYVRFDRVVRKCRQHRVWLISFVYEPETHCLRRAALPKWFGSHSACNLGHGHHGGAKSELLSFHFCVVLNIEEDEVISRKQMFFFLFHLLSGNLSLETLREDVFSQL